MNIMYATDKNYAPVCAASITSLLENNRECGQIRIFLFADRLGTYEEKMTGLVHKYGREIEVIQAAPIVDAFKKMNVPKVSGSYSSYVRLAASEKLKEIDKFLYIDCDTLIFHNIEELYDRNIERYAAGAVCDGISARCNLALGRTIQDLYFNAGILLVNAEYWRKKDVLHAMIDDLNKYNLNQTTTGSDQEMINFTLYKKIYKLPLKYNVLAQNRIYEPRKMRYMIEKNDQNYYSLSEMKEAKEDPYIVHFASSTLIRPWFLNSYDPLTGKWDDYLSRSGFSFEKKEQKISRWQKMCILALKTLPAPIYMVLKRYENRMKQYYIRTCKRK